jgi:hypothetical protein
MVGADGLVARGASLLVLLGGIAGCGPAPAPPVQLVPIAPPLASSAAIAPPLAPVATDSLRAPRLGNWASPASLSDQLHLDSRRDHPPEENPHYALSFDDTGTRAAIVRGASVSVLVRQAGSATWKQVLREPWALRDVAWTGTTLRLCARDRAVGGIAASFEDHPADWSVLASADCARPPTRSTHEGPSSGWTVKVDIDVHARCSGRMNPHCEAFSESVLTGPQGKRITLKGGAVRPALAASGRFFAYQARDGSFSILETATQKTLPVDHEGGDLLQSMRWLDDESAVALFYETGSLSLIEPTSGKKSSGWSERWSRPTVSVALDFKSGELSLRPGWVRARALVAKAGTGSLPRDAEKTATLPGARMLAFGNGTWALWDRDSGKAMTTLDGALSFEISPSRRFVAVARDRCERSFTCGGEVAIVDVASGAVRWRLELPEVTASTELGWLGPADLEVLAVLERSGHFLRPSDGTVLHAEPPASDGEKGVVVWTERGLVDASAGELGAWAFRAAGQTARVLDAAGLERPGLWRDFREGRGLSDDKASGESTRAKQGSR